MGRSDLERLSLEKLIESVLRLQRSEKTSRTSSKPPATDRKERREQSRLSGSGTMLGSGAVGDRGTRLAL
jgi:transposase